MEAGTRQEATRRRAIAVDRLSFITSYQSGTQHSKTSIMAYRRRLNGTGTQLVFTNEIHYVE